MCVTSMIADGYLEKFRVGTAWPGWPPPDSPTVLTDTWPAAPPTRAEFEALRREVAALRDLLIAARRFDRKTDQPDCEDGEKMALIKRLAELVGVDLSAVTAT